MKGNASIFELLESAIEKIKRIYPADWFISNAEWDSHPYTLFSNLSNSRKNMPHSEYQVHSFYECTILLEGRSAVRVEDNVKEMDAGDVFILLPGQYHQDLPFETGRYLAMWMAFEPGEVRVHLAGRGDDNEVFVKGHCTLDIDYILYSGLFYDIQKELNHHSRWSLDIIKIDLLNLLIIINKNLELKKHTDSGEDWKNAIVKSVIQYINDNYQKNPTLSDIAQRFGISMNYLNSIFKASAGKTVINYFNDYKIIKAKELLRTTDMRIKEIAIVLDYYDQYHFCKSFKKSIGISPTEFRRSAVPLEKKPE